MTSSTAERPQAADATSAYASPVDTSTYGECTVPRSEGLPLYRRTGRLDDDDLLDHGSGPRFHLYAGWFCPWAQRATITLELRALQHAVSVSYVDGARDGRGWAFRESTGPDPVNGFTLLREAYEASELNFDGHVSVPALWDRHEGRVLVNDPVLLETDLAALPASAPSLYPPGLAAEIDELDTWVAPTVTTAVHFAREDAAARGALLGSLSRLDQLLATRNHLAGDRLTLADVRLWVTLVRYDAGPNADGALGPRLDTYPHLWAWARALYALPAFRRTTRFSSFTAAGARRLDWEAPTARAAVARTRSTGTGA